MADITHEMAHYDLRLNTKGPNDACRTLVTEVVRNSGKSDSVEWPGSTSHGYWEKPGFVEPLPIPKGAKLYRPGDKLPNIPTGPESPVRPENGPSDSPYRPIDVIPRKSER